MKGNSSESCKALGLQVHTESRRDNTELCAGIFERQDKGSQKETVGQKPDFGVPFLGTPKRYPVQSVVRYSY